MVNFLVAEYKHCMPNELVAGEDALRAVDAVVDGKNTAIPLLCAKLLFLDKASLFQGKALLF